METSFADEEACLRPVESIKYKVPVSTGFTFLPPVKKTGEALVMLYKAIEIVGSIIIPVPRIPDVLLSEQLLHRPVIYMRRNVPRVLNEFPRLTSAASMGFSLAIVLPVFSCCLMTCRCCCGNCGGARNVEEGDNDYCWRCLCFFTLGACCLAMLVAAGFAVVSSISTYAGVSDVIPFCNRSIGDLVTGYQKTQNEIDTILITDFSKFETEMGQRLDSCVRVIGNDIETGLAASPMLRVIRLIGHVSKMKTTADKARTSAHELADQVSKLAEKLTFPVVTSNVAKVTEKCITAPKRPPECDAVLDAKSLLSVQSGYLPQASGVLDAIHVYAAKLTVADAAFQVLNASIQGGQTPASKELFIQTAGPVVAAAKQRISDMGDDLADKANLFYVDKLEYPEDLVRGLDEHAERPYRKAEIFIMAAVGGSLALVGVLLIVLFLYLCGLLLVAWGSEEGCCNFRSGRWCFSLGACVFALLFGAVTVVATAGLTGSFLATRCGCDLADNLASRTLVDPISFGLSFVRHHSGSTEVKDLTLAVSAEYLRNVLARFGNCGEEPRSAYHLAGETLVRNASKALGLEKQISFLWNGFDMTTLKAQLDGITSSLNLTIDMNQTAEVGKKLKTMVNHSLALPTGPSEPDLKSLVSTINTNTDNADKLKTALTALKPVATQLGMTTEVDEAIKEVDDIIQIFHSCTRDKGKLQLDLVELDTVQEVGGKPVDTFAKETADVVADSRIAQEEFDKAKKLLDSRKEGLLGVIKGYTDFVITQIKDTIGNCKPAYTMYRSAWEVGCKGVVFPFSGFWFGVATYLAIGIPAMFIALFMSTLYSRLPKPEEEEPVPEPEEMEEMPPRPAEEYAGARGYAAGEPPMKLPAQPLYRKPRQGQRPPYRKPRQQQVRGREAPPPKKTMPEAEPEESVELVLEVKEDKGKGTYSYKMALEGEDFDEVLELKAQSKKPSESPPSVLSSSSCSCIFTNTPTPEPERPENTARNPGEKQEVLGWKMRKHRPHDDDNSDSLLHGDRPGAGEKKGKRQHHQEYLMRAEEQYEGREDVDKKKARGRLGMAESDEEFNERRDWGGGEVTDEKRRKAKKPSRRQEDQTEEPDQRQSPSDLLALVYEGSRAGIANLLRAVSQRALPSGSSVLGSITGSSRSLARRLFRWYRSIEDGGEEGGSSENLALP